MKTIEERFKRYIETVYPGGISEDERHQLRAAWFACAREAFSLVPTETGALPQRKALDAWEELEKEVESVCNEIALGR